MLRLGIVGLPNVGKSTLFNALANARAPAEQYPFCTVEPNVGVVEVPDARLWRIAELVRPGKATPTVVEFVDIAGLVEGASRGEGLGNQFLAHIREVDAIVHVVRCFAEPDVPHVTGTVDPVRDHDIVLTELALADLALVQRRLDKLRKSARTAAGEAAAEAGLLSRVVTQLDAGRGARGAAQTAEDAVLLRQLGVLTAKPVLYAANVGEADLPTGGPLVERLRAAVASQHEDAVVVVFSARLEAELSELSEQERAEFLRAAGLSEPGLDRLIRAGYRLLGLMTFFTVSEKEVRAWTIPSGASAYAAAGEVHTDFQRGFIRAETVHYEDFVRAGSFKTAREQGVLRSEGRDYVVQDGDVLLFRFSV